MRSNRLRRRAFTFVEVLAAMLFMAIVIPVVVEGLLVANRAGITAQRKRVAAQLADQKLTELVVTGLWLNGNQSGDFGDDWPDYRWEMTSTGWSEDAMQEITVKVDYTVQGTPRSEQLTTLLDPNATTGTTSTSSQSGL